MLLFEWNEDKNDWLKRERGVSFEEIEAAVRAGGLLVDAKNPSSKYPHQRILVVRIGRQTCVVPYVFKDGDTRFLKTAYPSRKFAKRFKKQ